MADKQALNATFFAFRKREKGGVLLGATLAYAVLAIVLGGLFFFLNAQGIMDYVNWVTNLSMSAGAGKPGAPPSMEMMMPPAGVMSLIPAYILFILFYYVLFAAYEAACLRWLIRGETGGLLGLTLGADTWRVYFGYWVWLFLLIAFYIVCAIVVGGTIFSMAAVMQGDMSNAGPAVAIVPPAVAIVPFVLVLVLLIGLLYFGVRFAPAAATSIARRRFAFFDAWKVTKGRLWPLFGAYLLLFLMYVVAAIVIAMAFGALIGANVAGQMGGLGAAPPETPEAAFRAFATPQMLASVVAVYALILGVVLVFVVSLFGVNARAAQAALEEGRIQAAT